MLNEPVTRNLRPPQPLGENLSRHWMLDPSIDFLNHGSFGATPRVVLDSQTRWRERIEARPVEMIARKAGELLDKARVVIGEFLGAAPADFGFTSNATAGVNAVLRSLAFAPGDELLTTTHVYRAVRQTMRHVCNVTGAVIREVDVPLPVQGEQDVIDAVTAGISPRTKLLVICHVTSATAIRFPVERIVKLCSEKGIDALIDGAHAAGVLDLDIESIGAAYYSGNLHKWMCAPKGSAFVWVRPDRQKAIHPNTISHYYSEGFATEFNWQGTRDLSAWICAAEAVEFMASLGWDRVRKHNHEMARWVQAHLTGRWGVEALSPLDGSMLGSMASVALPEGVRRFGTVEKLQAALFEEHRFEVPVIDFNGRWLVRPCCQVYNTPDQYERLGEVVAELAG
jgi:isopenicillin-N epimerase